MKSDKPLLQVKEKVPKLKRKAPPVKKKRAYVRKPVATVSKPDEDDSDEFYVREPRDPENKVYAGNPGARATWTPERLVAMVRAFVSDNDIDILERGKSGKRFLMLPWDQAVELAATILLACGHNVR